MAPLTEFHATIADVTNDQHQNMAGLVQSDDFNAEIGRQITSHVWGDIWTRPAIDLKTRRFMTLSIMIALRAWAEFRLHVRSGLFDCVIERLNLPIRLHRSRAVADPEEV